jgi:ABC-type antimicrobial peptide transport system permease subunit
VGREGKLSAVALKVSDVSAMSTTRNMLRAAIPSEYFVLGSKELSEGILDFFGSTRVVLYIMAAVAIIISIFSIVNTMLMAVLERRKEIAYLKCVGAGSRDLLRLISLETLAICLIGSTLGTVAGLFISPVFGGIMRKFLIAFVPAGNIASPSAGLAAIAFTVCLLVGLGCALYPAYRASKIVPMEVLRNE